MGRVTGSRPLQTLQTSTWAASVRLIPEDTDVTWTTEIAEEHDGYWTIHDPVTGIFGSGPDRETAHADFERALREHLDVLERQHELSPELSSQLAYLRQRLT